MGGEDGAPEKFFERTYLTQNLTAMAAEVVRRSRAAILKEIPLRKPWRTSRRR
jgi:hypothetical protein